MPKRPIYLPYLPQPNTRPNPLPLIVLPNLRMIPYTFKIRNFLTFISFCFSRQLGLIQMLYNPSALQCKNCGLRYSPTDMIEYSQHLDWHFRMKRREKENAKKAQSRNWYFEREDWINSDEIVDGVKGNL